MGEESGTTLNRSPLDLRSGLLWLVCGLVVGAVVLAGSPFGAGHRSDPEMLNGFVLAFTPLVALNRLYAPIRAQRAAGRGLEERTTIGGRAMLPTSAVHALGPAAALVWTEDGRLLGAALTCLVALSWWLYLEIQRRTRVILRPGQWTSRELDRLENNYEILAITGLWALVGAACAATDQLAAPHLMSYVIGLLVLGISATSIRAACVIATRDWRVIVVATAAVAASVTTWSIGAWVPFGALPAVCWFAFLESRRRRERSRRSVRISEEVSPSVFARRYPDLALARPSGARS